MSAFPSRGGRALFRPAYIFTTLALAAAPIAAQAENPPQKIDIGGLPAQVVGEVVIPIPQEIFSSLDKLGHQNWKGHLMRKDAATDGKRSRTALIFGLVIAEGFIAVQAEDKEEVKRIGREVLLLAEKLGVKQQVQGHAGAIMDGANASDWTSVRRELDKTRQTVVGELESSRDQELSDLVSLGGWLGGTRVLSAVLEEHYDPEASELLHQPDLVRRIHERYLKLPASARAGALFTSVENVLSVLTTLMKTDAEGKVPSDAVKEIHRLTADLAGQVFP